MDVFHTPVLLDQALEGLHCRRGGTYLDGTVGGGGHAEAILERTAPDGRLIGLDLDDDALSAAQEKLCPYGDRKILIKANFADAAIVLKGLHISGVDGILLDLGVSSHQLNTAQRGFSFSQDAPLDMRMDRYGRTSASDLVNTLSERDLEKILRELGEERMARRIVRMISKRRKQAPIATTGELVRIIEDALPAKYRTQRIHPATRTFQALRIAVNDELANLCMALHDGIGLLNGGGRFCVIAFHSLEDRIVKDAFRAAEKGCICPPDLPACNCQKRPVLRVLTKKPVRPEEQEILVNPRARSARLRVAEKI